MGESDRYQEYRKLSRRRFTLGQPGNALFALFAANIVGFFLILISRVFYLYGHQTQGMEALDFDAIHWFAVPANLTQLGQTPWTLLTFMFSQGGGEPFSLMFTMLSTMLWLWTFGFIMQDLAGNKLIFPIYIYGSLLGAVFYLTAVNTIPSTGSGVNGGYLFGSQMGTAAIAAAVTTLSPNYRIFKNIGKGIPVWVLTGLYILINLIVAFSLTGAKSFAILGGALAGFLFIILLRRGTDGSIWMHNFYNWISNLFNPNKKGNVNTLKEKVFYNTGNRKPFSKTANVTQERIDQILDKISQRGYHFLTDEEKSILKRASEEEL
ncbi:MAG: rhomboid family intramembrane serine protease [Ferruginibacter sp.]